MLNTTLCYIEKDNKYLMLHRVKKVNDLNHDKWVGIGGKFMENETPEECLLREVKEETGLTLTEYRLRGIVTFLSDKWEGEYMYLFTATDYTGEMIECDEGNLEWVPVDKVCDLPIWEGDKLFFNELSNGKSFFTMMLKYEGERLIDHSVKYHG
ncbi:MAG: 8-oxo-dGTP diphosphatase [Lachnospiraceae bacterium]|nr:8-oxo-dGTP diphosphatase [Lachnospiraceae bacterium]